jgi:hypothetical protein
MWTYKAVLPFGTYVNNVKRKRSKLPLVFQTQTLMLVHQSRRQKYGRNICNQCVLIEMSIHIVYRKVYAIM